VFVLCVRQDGHAMRFHAALLHHPVKSLDHEQEAMRVFLQRKSRLESKAQRAALSSGALRKGRQHGDVVAGGISLPMVMSCRAQS
jgi:hypothetical protein